MWETIRARIAARNTPMARGDTDNPDMAIYGDRLKELMATTGDSQASLATRARVTQPTIQRILSGEIANPKSDTLRKLAHAFVVDVSTLTSARNGLDAVCEVAPPVYQVPLVDLLNRLAALLDGHPEVRHEAISLIARYLERPEAREQIGLAIRALIDERRKRR